MTKTVLVTFASQTEATAEVAEFIGKTLEEQGMIVTVKAVDQVTDLNRYQALVIGSGVKMDKTYREAQEFLKRSRQSLLQKQFAAFITCGSLSKDTAENRDKAQKYANQLAEAASARPLSQGLFAGRMDMSRAKGLIGLLMRKSASKAEDWRDWDSIRGWAVDLAQQLN
jgi:menaquinone-dependent protoporphyrinogen oxidase